MLTDAAIRAAKPGDKLRKLSDGGGLYLAVLPAGGRSWRFKYRIAGKEKLLVFGTWPEVSLAAARRKRDEARSRLSSGRRGRGKRERLTNTALGRILHKPAHQSKHDGGHVRTPQWA